MNTTTIETFVSGEWILTVAPAQTKPHLTYSSRAAAERALPFLPPRRRYRLSALGLPVTVH
jgi:hypothetical protein